MHKSLTSGFSLALLISFFLHGVIFTGILFPDLKSILEFRNTLKKSMSGGRDIIVNINQDNIRKINRETLLSDKDSLAKGYLTKKAGNRWLNNSLDFRLVRGAGKSSSRSEKAGRSVKVSKDRKILLSEKSEVVAMLSRPLKNTGGTNGFSGYSEKILVPDKNDVTRKNAIFYSNNGMFSFNTAKFKNFKYFKNMKDKIAANWYPPLMANAVFGGNYAPGYTRIMAIPSQEVKLYFIMNRNGDVLDVKVLESLGNLSLDSSCVDAIRFSGSFGPVPKNIKGDRVVIPFIFGYYAN